MDINKPCLFLCLSMLAMNVSFAAEPDLPEGLFDEPSADTSPELPTGLDNLEIGTTVYESPDFDSFEPLEVSGFWELRSGLRLQNDRNEPKRSIAETRLQLDIEKNFSALSTHIVTDIIYDDLADSQNINFENGQGWLDLREANISFTPSDFLDVKIGRQILTWGTGDLLFINDLFPKGWQDFFIGRDVEYLKAPSDAIKLAFYSELVNLDFVYTPRFDADRFIDGSRISYFNPITGQLAGQDTNISIIQPDKLFRDDEFALRLYRNFSTIEIALYAYDGFWKSPVGFEPLSASNTFPKLRTYGASLRLPVGKGIGNIELGYFDSRDDKDGSNPFVSNSEFRFLIGYEQEMGKNLTLGVQYYLERILDHDNYLVSLPLGFLSRDQNRHVLTGRLTKLSHQQNMRWSLFAYLSPSDEDFYLRANVNYKFDDQWSFELGANVFGGKYEHTFFAQFENNTNLYGSIRFGF